MMLLRTKQNKTFIEQCLEENQSLKEEGILQVEKLIEAIEKFSLVEQDFLDIKTIVDLEQEHKFLLTCSLENFILCKLEFMKMSCYARQLLLDIIYHPDKCCLKKPVRGRPAKRSNLRKKVIQHIRRNFTNERSESFHIMSEIESFVSSLPTGSLFKIVF